MSELLPCPFCGDAIADVWSPANGGYSVICGNGCGGEGPVMENEERAAEAWNRRYSLGDDLAARGFAEVPSRRASPPAQTGELVSSDTGIDELYRAGITVMSDRFGVHVRLRNRLIGTYISWNDARIGAEKLLAALTHSPGPAEATTVADEAREVLERVERELRRATRTGLHPYQVMEIHSWIAAALSQSRRQGEG